MNDNTKNLLINSKDIIEKGLEITSSNRPDLEGTFDFVLNKGKGPYVWDFEGNKYIDYTASTGAIILGYNYPTVTNAVIKGLKEQPSMLPTTISDVHVNLASELLRIFKGFDRILFFKTGSCATTAAVRLARLYSNKQLVLTSGYHGWHDWHLNMFPVFTIKDPNYIEFRYNLNFLEKMLKENKGNVACVILTPEPNFFDINYFKELRELCDKFGTILIFDEVISGFRYQLGGFYSQAEVQPDLLTISKGLTNGYALSAVLGKRDIMKKRESTHLVGTYHNEITPMLAALACLSVLEKQNVIPYLLEIGSLFMNGLNILFKKFGIRAKAHRHPSLFHIIFEDLELEEKFYKTVFSQGVLLHPYDPQLVNFGHTEKDIELSLKKIENALNILREIYPNKFNAENPGEISQEAFDFRTFHEFGGTINYKKPLEEAESNWSWRHKEAMAS